MICSSNVNSRRTTHLVLVIVNSYLDGQTDDLEVKGPFTNRLGYLAFPLAITPFASSIPLTEYSDRDENHLFVSGSGVNLSWTFDDLSV